MWKLVYCSVRGTSHLRTDQSCQDYGMARSLNTDSGPALIVACADGAGSAELSDVGARLAVETFLDHATEVLAAGPEPDAINEAVLTAWVASARARVEEEAAARGVTARHLACTLLAAVVGPAAATFVQVGDGVIVFDGPDGYDFAFWPDGGEYANTTRFLTDPDFDRHLRADRLPRRIEDLAILTDGLQALALGYAAGRVHERFFRPLFETLRISAEGVDLRPALEAFLDSERVNARTDDDKTLILATRRLPDDAHVPNGKLDAG